jgi:MFS transporter, ACS family, glucarate transporter
MGRAIAGWWIAPISMSGGDRNSNRLVGMQQRPTRVRHMVLWLTVAAYLITYMDRTVISSAAPFIRQEFGFSIETMGLILGAFRLGYSLFQIPGGWLGDRFGPRRALTAIVLWWSAFTSLTAVMTGAFSMMACRFLFGIGEAGAFPIATRSLSRWMLASERGWAQGLTHAGSRLGAAFTPPIVAWMILAYGWRMPFLWFGVMGIAWALLWFFWYRDTPEEHGQVNEAERELIQQSLGSKRSARSGAVPWRLILSSRVTLMLSVMYFCYGWCQAIYLDWLPTYLRDFRGYDIKKMGLYASLPLFAGALGNLVGGWLTDRMAKRSGNLREARRVVGIAGFVIAALGIVPATLTGDPELSVAFSCLAFFGLEITISVSWAIPLDIGGDFAGSVSAVMNTCGNIGGTISTVALGFIVSNLGWNVPFYIGAGFCVLGAILYLGIDASRNLFRTEPGATSS